MDSISTPIYDYRSVHVNVNDDGILEWKDVEESNISMFVNTDPEMYNKAMSEVIKKLTSVLPDIQERSF